jgi:hypothetical protein
MHPGERGDRKDDTMGIDGIGGGKPPIGPLGTNGASKSGGEGFSLDRTSSNTGASDTGALKAGASNIGATEAANPTADLDRLRSGEISLDDYLQTRANKAVAHLESVVPPEELSIIKEQLIHQMKQDPSVASLVQRATGTVPTDNES